MSNDTDDTEKLREALRDLAAQVDSSHVEAFLTELAQEQDGDELTAVIVDFGAAGAWLAAFVDEKGPRGFPETGLDGGLDFVEEATLDLPEEVK